MSASDEVTRVFGTKDGWLCVMDEDENEYYLIPQAHYHKRNGNKNVLFSEAQVKEWVELGEFVCMGEE